MTPPQMGVSRLGVWERRKLPQWVWSGAPAENGSGTFSAGQNR